MSKSIDEQIAELKKQIAVLERQKELGETNINADKNKITIKVQQPGKIIFCKETNDEKTRVDLTFSANETPNLVLDIFGDSFTLNLGCNITTKGPLEKGKSKIRITQVDCPGHCNGYIDITHNKKYYEIEIMCKFI